MGETKREVKTYEVDMVCPKCDIGLMRPMGNIVLTSYPIQYPHQCTLCGYEENYLITYPYTTTERIGE